MANLIDNAVKYSDAGSSVVVTARIADACGDLQRIFERFYRADRARSSDTGGTGLDLSIVRHVATNQGGDVSVESAKERAPRPGPASPSRDWVLPDPAGKSVEEVRPVRDEIGRRVGDLLASLGILARGLR